MELSPVDSAQAAVKVWYRAPSEPGEEGEGVSILPVGTIWVVALWLLVILVAGVVIAYRPKGEDRGGVKLQIMSAMCAMLAIALSIYGYILGDTILESIVLVGVAMFMSFVAITNRRKPDSN